MAKTNSKETPAQGAEEQEQITFGVKDFCDEMNKQKYSDRMILGSILTLDPENGVLDPEFAEKAKQLQERIVAQVNGMLPADKDPGTATLRIQLDQKLKTQKADWETKKEAEEQAKSSYKKVASKSSKKMSPVDQGKLSVEKMTLKKKKEAAEDVAQKALKELERTKAGIESLPPAKTLLDRLSQVL